MYIPRYSLSRFARSLLVAVAFAVAMVRDRFAFAVSLFGGLARPAPTVADPLECAKLTASQSRTLAAAKRERPVISASWRRSPSC